jgi:myo-inositol-1(or 4)-monophosphatase
MQRYLMQQGAQIYLNMASAMTLAYVAAGRLDGCWLNLVATQSVLAGQLLAREAGALVGDFSGNSQTPQQHELVVASPKLFKLMLQSIRRVRQAQSIQTKGTCMNQNNG